MRLEMLKWLSKRFIDDDLLNICLGELGPREKKKKIRRNSWAAVTLPHQKTSSINFEPFFLLKIWIWWYPSLTPKISRQMPDKCPDIYQSTISLSCFFPFPCSCWQYITAFDPSCLNVCWMSHKFSKRAVSVCCGDKTPHARSMCGMWCVKCAQICAGTQL